MSEQYGNLAQSTLKTAISAAATSLVVNSATNFPASATFHICVCAIDATGTISNYEIMVCTARSGTTLTVTRGQEGTAAVAHTSGETVANVLTAGVISALQSAIPAPGTYVPYTGATADLDMGSHDITSSAFFLPAASLGSQTGGMIYDSYGLPIFEFGINMAQFASAGYGTVDPSASGVGIRVDNRETYGFIQALFQDQGTQAEYVPFFVSNPNGLGQFGKVPWVVVGDGSDAGVNNPTGNYQSLQVADSLQVGYWVNQNGSGQQAGYSTGGGFALGCLQANYAMDISDVWGTGTDIGNSTTGSWSIDNNGNFSGGNIDVLAVSGNAISGSVNVLDDGGGDGFIYVGYYNTVNVGPYYGVNNPSITTPYLQFTPEGEVIGNYQGNGNLLLSSGPSPISSDTNVIIQSGTGAGQIVLGQAGDDVTVQNNIYVNSSLQFSNAAYAGILGQTFGTNAAAGVVGEYLSLDVPFTAGTATITIASPAVVTKTAHGLATLTPVVFTTTGALPTGITAGTVYYVCNSTTNTFQLATSFANALAYTRVNTTGTQSGTHTVTSGMPMVNNTPVSAVAIQLSAGDWDVWGGIVFNAGGLTTATSFIAALGSTINTLPGVPGVSGGSEGAYAQIGVSVAAGGLMPIMPIGTKRISTSGNLFVYLTAQSTFATSTMTASGGIYARRVR